MNPRCKNMKYAYIAAVLACALSLGACKDSSRDEQRERENAQVREEMERMRAELEAMKRAAAESQAREEQARAEERRAREAEARAREEELRTPAHARTNRDTGMSVDDIVAQLQKYASVGDIRYNEFSQRSYTVGEGFLQHYNLMKDGLETITDYPYVAVVMSLALQNGPSSLPKERYLKTLLAAGASPNGFCDGEPALVYAARNGLEECVRILLEAGADVDAQMNSFYDTALGEACARGHAGCVKLLLQAGADVNAKADNGRTPMERATYGEHMDCVRLLQASGKVSSTQYGAALEEAADSNDAAAVRQILDAGGATADSCSKALLKALGKGRDYLKPEIVEMLLKAGADPNVENRNEVPALSQACEKGSEACVKLLLEAGANVNGTDKMGDTPLAYAGKPACVQLLLDAGADVNAKNSEGVSVLGKAVSNNLSEVVELMAGTGKLDRTLCTREMVKVLADQSRGRLEADCIKHLLAAGANPNAKDSEGFTVLMLACEEGRDEVARLLLRNGAKVNATGPGNTTALMTSCRRGRAECVKLLLKSKANINIRSVRNMTAVDYADENNYPECRELLRAAGAVETSPLERQ